MRNAMIIDGKDNVIVAIEPIAKGEPVVKYGEHIGIAVSDIKAGAHVHVHNVEGHRENLDDKA